MEVEGIVNKVEQSGLVNFNLEDYYPKNQRIGLDLKDQLWQGLLLKEKDFRDYISQTDWTIYQDKLVAVYCSTEAIIPVWAYMLVASSLQPFAAKIVFGDLTKLEELIFHDAIQKIDLTPFQDQRIIVRGCSKYPVPASAYLEITSLLKPIAKSIMFGEACSTVPIYKKKNG
ncbi:MAG: DUF2480 family protein [Bacteroidia bacterium]|nr:DUF2480 family protein [Bacteroidia bacterium]